MSTSTRREILGSALTATFLAATTSAPAGEQATAPATAVREAFGVQLTPAPLPFDAKSLKGLSEKLIQSHWENNYSGAVRALNTVRGRLAQAIGDAELPPYVYTGLKREQLMRTGSVVLHELYFGNLGGNGTADAVARTRLGAAFGSYDRWETEFRRIGQGLAGGSGWVVLGYNHSLGLMENYWMADHATGPVSTTPLLVMDMYEHAFAIDYGAAAARYIDAFFANIQWEVVLKRLAAAA